MKKITVFLLCFLGLNTVFSQNFSIENNKLVLPSPIVFETGSDKLKAESDVALAHIKQFLDAKTYISLLRIEGHTDNSNDAQANQVLSEKRALAVVNALVQRGVDCKRLLAVGFGGTKPIAANNSPENRAQNRRIEIHITMLRGKAIGGMPTDGGGKVVGFNCNN